MRKFIIWNIHSFKLDYFWTCWVDKYSHVCIDHIHRHHFMKREAEGVDYIYYYFPALKKTKTVPKKTDQDPKTQKWETKIRNIERNSRVSDFVDQMMLYCPNWLQWGFAYYHYFCVIVSSKLDHLRWFCTRTTVLIVEPVYFRIGSVHIRLLVLPNHFILALSPCHWCKLDVQTGNK